MIATIKLEKNHFPVLLDELISIISPLYGGTFIDCTFGQGGYSKKILSNKNNKFCSKKYYWEIMQWFFYQISQVGPFLGQAHQFLYYHQGQSLFAEKKYKDYVKRVYDTLDKRLEENEFLKNRLRMRIEQKVLKRKEDLIKCLGKSRKQASNLILSSIFCKHVNLSQESKSTCF